MFDEKLIQQHQEKCNEKRIKFLDLKIEGEWMKEPDRYEFEHKGLNCLLVRNSEMFNWCGYVGIPSTHPYYGIKYFDCSLPTSKPRGEKEIDKDFPLPMPDRIKKMREEQRICKEDGWCDHRPESKLEVHGGITYSDKCYGYICHKPKKGEPDNIWWFGFDCAHAFDSFPLMEIHRIEIPELGKVHKECEDKLKQLGAENLARVHYRNMEYVISETKRLAEQLIAINNDDKSSKNNS